MVCLLPFMMFVPLLPGQIPSAEEIMCRVAENQERAEKAREAYVYDMNVFVRLKRSNGKPAREESRDYVIAPSARGSHRKLLRLQGKIFDGGKEIPYTTARFEHKKVDVDGSLTDTFARELMWKRGDAGPMLDWFPLTQKRQRKYTFSLLGEERYRDFDVYRVSFQEEKVDGEGKCWSGEALIEKNEFQPVLVTTQWECKVPAAATVMLGTSISQFGAKIVYQRLDRDVWFPAVCGGELKLRVLFMYARTIAFSAGSANFRKTDVQSSVDFESVDNE